MSYNLFIAYDLDAPGQNYDAVQNAIKSLGQWWLAQYSLFYVHTDSCPNEAFALIHAAMDANDKLAVINCDSALGAILTNWDHPPIDAINAIWSTP
jgi:hypothetical protein